MTNVIFFFKKKKKQYRYYVHGSKAYNTISNRIKKEVENCEDFDTFLIIQSLAGGTGSGLGKNQIMTLSSE